MSKVSSKIFGSWKSWSVRHDTQDPAPDHSRLDRAACFECMPQTRPDGMGPQLPAPTPLPHKANRVDPMNPVNWMIGDAPPSGGVCRRTNSYCTITPVRLGVARWTTTSRPCCNRSREGTGVAFGTR